jgi:diacylglycerol O-acyltransferase
VAAHTPLTALEASFLALERPGLPMHVAGVVLVDASTQAGGPLTVKDLRHLVTSRMSRFPRFGQRVGYSWLGLLRPEWIEVSDLDPDGHLYHHRLGRGGGTAQLARLCGQIHETLLPRDRPLWEMHLIDGLSGNRQALVVKTHHAVADGIAAIQLAEALFDRARAARKRANGGLPTLQFTHESPPSLVGMARALVGVAFTVAGGPIALMGPYNGQVGAQRAFAMATISMDVVRRLKQQLGGTVDDILLAVIAAGLARQLTRAHYPGQPQAMRAMVPVSTWVAAGDLMLGNHVTAVFIDLPTDTSDLAALVRRIATSKSNLRTSHAAAGMSVLIEAAGRLPRPLHEAVVRFAASLTTANLVLSDVPGPCDPLFVLGRPVVACYPMIPLPPAVGLSVAAVSLGGQIGVGIVADPNLVPNPQGLAADIEAAVKGFERSHLPGLSSPRIRKTQHRAA